MLQQIIEKAKEFQISIGICFIDYRKAFDSVDQEKLWETLYKYTNIDPAYINLISLIYDNSRAQIRTDIGTTDEIPLLRGVKQGDLLSALLFCTVLKVIMEKTILPNDMSISIGGVRHTDGAYTDDLGVIGSTIPELNDILRRLKQNSSEFGLNINMSKTKVMLIGEHDSNLIPTIDNESIEIASKFEYLGRVLSNDGSDMPALVNRIGKAWGAFEKKKELMTSKHLSMRSKKQTYETYILPVAMYATETMTWTQEMLNKIDVFNNHIMRWMCGAKLRDKKSIASLRQRTQVKPIIPTIKARKTQMVRSYQTQQPTSESNSRRDSCGEKKAGSPKQPLERGHTSLV